MDLLNLIITLASGAVGGNLAGAATKEKNLGTLANTLIGLVGGGAGDYLVKALGILATTAATGGGFDLTSLLANIGVSGVSGAALTAIITYAKDALQKK